MKTKHSLLLLLLLSAASSAWAGEANLNFLLGLPREELEQRMGKPDDFQGTPHVGRETWHYGRSIVFITEGKVSAWSDNGELAELARSSEFRSRKAEAGSKNSSAAKTEAQRWINDWTPRRKMSVEQAIDEIDK